jgi:hypothetical protein
MNTDQVVVNGQVAVLYSPGHGSGWSTWNRDNPQCVFDPRIVKWVQAGKPSQEVAALETHVYNTYGPDFYVSSNLLQLEIEWIPQGTQFMVEERDGSESIRTRDSTPWITA